MMAVAMPNCMPAIAHCHIPVIFDLPHARNNESLSVYKHDVCMPVPTDVWCKAVRCDSVLAVEATLLDLGELSMGKPGSTMCYCYLS